MAPTFLLRWRLSTNKDISWWSKERHFICKAPDQLQLLSPSLCDRTVACYSSSAWANIYSWTLQICPFHQVRNLRRGPDDAFGPDIGRISPLYSEKWHNKRCKENWAFHCLTHTHTHSLSGRVLHIHTIHTHTPIIKGERSSPPSLFASSKSP